VSVIIYIEGGGQGKSLRGRCREGFSVFFRKAGFEGRMPRVVACGSRNDALGDFCAAMKGRAADIFYVLLVDSEGEVKAGSTAWDHLRERDGWQRPPGSEPDQAHLMVQCMESWFLADKESLSRYFGTGFRMTALPANPKIEQIPKNDVLHGLENASRPTSKGRYDKGDHSFAILGAIDPGKLDQTTAPYARALFDTLNKKCPAAPIL
jgi:hypothetical protein